MNCATRITLLVALVLCPLAIGCGEPEPEKKTGIDISFPGGSVKIGGEDGVDVKAPGVEVKSGKDGTSVKAPNTNVEVK